MSDGESRDTTPKGLDMDELGYDASTEDISAVDEEQIVAQGDEQSIAPPPDYEAEIQKLRQKLGTDEDVNVVKSQRDQLRNQLQQIQAQWEAERQELQALMQQAQQQLQWYQQQYVQQMPPEQQQAWAQQAQQMQLQQYIQALQAQNQQYQQMIAQQRQQQAVERIKATIIGAYQDAATAAGVDPGELDTSSYEALQKSYNDKVRPMLGRKQPPSPPQVPNRGAPTPQKGVDQWFAETLNNKGWNEIERIFDLAGQGIDPRTLMR